MHVGRTGSDETDTPVVARLTTFSNDFAALARSAFSRSNISGDVCRRPRHHHPAHDVPVKPGTALSRNVTDGHQRLDVADARRQAQDDRRLEAFESSNAASGNRRPSRESAGSSTGTCEAAPVARNPARSARGQPTSSAMAITKPPETPVSVIVISASRRRSCRRASSHRTSASRPSPRRTRLPARPVDRPFCVKIGIGRDHLEHLSRRRAGIGGGHAHTRLPYGTRHGIVT